MFDVDRWYTPEEIWRESHGARAQVYEALDSGELRAIRRGRRWLIPGSAARAWIAAVLISEGPGSSRPGLATSKEGITARCRLPHLHDSR